MLERFTNNDTELLKAMALGSQRAFDTLYHRYSKKVYVFALRILRSELLAEEVMQEVMLKVWLLGKETTDISNLEAYLRKIARNTSLNLLRRQEIERRAETILSSEWEEARYDTEEYVLLSDAKRVLEEAINLLPPQQQLAFRLCHQQGLKYHEAATEMGLSTQTVAVHVKLALRFVRTYVKKATDILAFLVILRLL